MGTFMYELNIVFTGILIRKRNVFVRGCEDVSLHGHPSVQGRGSPVGGKGITLLVSPERRGKRSPDRPTRRWKAVCVYKATVSHSLADRQ